MPQDRAMRGFIIHLGIFVVVVGLLAAINLYRRPDHIWFIWVLAGWGIGLAAHDLALLLQRTGRKEAIFTDARVRGFFLHLFVYVAVNALLIIVNLLYMPNYYWFLFPLIGWGLLRVGPRLRRLLSQARERLASRRSNRSKVMKKARLWYVIADGGRARFVERDDQGAFRTLSSFVSTELHTTAHELGRDRPSRVKESASPARSAIEPRRDLHEAAKEDFIRTVADTLAADLKDEKFDELVLVAPPGVIAELKGSLSKPTAKVVVKELHKDLTKVPDHELTGHLAQ